MSFEDMKEKAGEIVDGIKDKFKGSIQEKVGDLES